MQVFDFHYFYRVSAVSIISLLLLSACASPSRDNRYLHSEQRPSLLIPSGMDTPFYNARMHVPDAAPIKVDQVQDLEAPPKLDINN